MKKTFAILLISIFLLFEMDSALAIELENPLRYGTFKDLIYSIIDFIFYIAVVLAPIMIIIGGFMFITAAGDPKRIEAGKKMMLYTAIGFAIILLAKGLISVIEQVIGVKVGP